MGKTKTYLIGIAAGGIAAGCTAIFLKKRKSSSVSYDEMGLPTKKRKPLSEAKDTFLNLKEQITTIKNEGMPAVKTTINDISNLVKAFQKDIQPHLSQIKEDLGELEQAKEKLESETAKPSPK